MIHFKIYVITLQGAVERQAECERQLEQHPFEWHFIDAVDGRKLTSEISEYPQKKVKRLLGFDLTNSEIGCFMSHRKAWEQVVVDGLPGLILEDDFVLEKNFDEGVVYALEQQSTWDFLRLQGLTDREASLVLSSENGFSIVENSGDPLGATATIVTPEAAQHLLKSSKEIYEPLDHYLEHSEKHGLKIKALKPYPVRASGVETTIPDRPYSERSIRGAKKLKRSFFRALDRKFSPDPWFKK
jgi:glycosyl transferase family 25